MEKQNKVTTRWSKTEVTDIGTALLAEFAAGRILEITAAYGSASAGENLMELKELPDGRAHPLTIESVTRTDNSVTACIQVTSVGNPAPYKMDMVGLYAVARDPAEKRELGEPDGGLRDDKLLMVIKDTEDERGSKGVTIPAETDQLYTFKLYAVLTITNKERLEISVSTAGIATVGAIDDAMERHNGDQSAHHGLMGEAFGAHNTDQEAHPATVARVRGLELAMNGKETIVQEGEPTIETVGKKRQHYIDISTGSEWECTNITDGGYIWELVDYNSEDYKSMREIMEETAATADQAKAVAEAAAKAIAAVQNTISAIPSQYGSLKYNGSALLPNWNNLDLEMMTIAYGEERTAAEDYTGETEAGTYKAYVTPKADFTWGDKSRGEKEIIWTIGRAIIMGVPAQSGTLTYNGSAQSPVWSGHDAAKLTIGGTTSGTNAGSYNATFTPGANYQWNDGTTAAKTVAWTIRRASVAVPAQSGTLTYNGAEQSPVWNGYDAAKLTLGGTAKGTNAGSYNATFTPVSNYQWSDGTTAAKTVAWSIGKAAGSSSLNKSSLALSTGTMSGTISVTRAGNGAVSASSSNTNVATVSVSGTTVTVTAKAKGTATITVKVAEGTNHTAPANRTCSVSVTLPTTSLNDNTWATIKEVSDAGQGENYWSVGDTKRITINGKVGNFTFSNLAIDAFIIGFNHNSSREGTNRIHFQIGKIGGKDVCLWDGESAGSFKMNQESLNLGGWNGSYGRKEVLGNSGTPSSPPENSLLAALPADLRAVMKPVTKYSDNHGGKNDIASYVTETTDYLFNLSEFEFYGVRSNANSAEKNFQLQYAYYKAGNSEVKYKHDETEKVAYQWTRSVYSTSVYGFCTIGPASSNANYSWGMAPGFAV